MDYLKILRENPDLADEFDSLLTSSCWMSYPRGMTQRDDVLFPARQAFARDGSGGEYHLLEDGSIGYYSSEGEAGRLAESMDDLFSLLVNCICWHDCCDAKQYVDQKPWRNMGRDVVTATWKIWTWAAGGGYPLRSVSQQAGNWLPFWSGSVKQHSASPCISVCSMRTTEV